MATRVPMGECDENLINGMILHQDLPNMPKLQDLLRSLCTRLSDQGRRIEMAEEHGRAASLLKDEFEHLSQKVLEDLKAAQEAERNNIALLIDDKIKEFVSDKLKGLDGKVDDLARRLDGKVDDLARQLSDLLEALQGVDLSVLKSLPDCLAELEEKTAILQDRIGLQVEQLENDVNKGGPKKMSIIDHSDRILTLEEQIKDLKTFVQDSAKVNSSDIDALQKITRNLRNDLDMLPIVDHGPLHFSPATSKDGVDISGPLLELQNRLQKKADKETVDQLIRSAGQAKESLEKMRHAYDELKNLAGLPPSRRTSLQNPKTIEQVSQAISYGEDALNDLRLKQLHDEINSLAHQLASKADRKDIDSISFQVSLLEGSLATPRNVATPLNADAATPLNSDAATPINADVAPPRSADAAPQGKADVAPPNHAEAASRRNSDVASRRNSDVSHTKHSDVTSRRNSDVDNTRHSDGAHTRHSDVAHTRHSDVAHPRHSDGAHTRSGDDEVEKIKHNVKGLQNALQKMQDMVSKKADRDEIIDGSNGKFDNEAISKLMYEIENINSKIKTMEERSDLNVLITKRLENFAKPAATVSPTSADLSSITDAVNEHALRMMEYADTLLQIQTELATKADAAGLKALRSSIIDLKKKNSQSGSLIAMEPPEQSKDEPELQIVYQSVPAINTQNELVEKHEEILRKLLKDIALLGEGILTLSGHNQNQNDKNINDQPESPVEDDVAEQEFLIKKEEPLPSLQTTEDEPQRRESFLVKKEEPLAPLKRDKQTSITGLEEALNNHLIKPKGDEEVVNKLAQEIPTMAEKMKEFDETLHALRDNSAEKEELQKIKNFIKESLSETAMFSGRGLPGFKCMSCAHRLEKLNPNRADFLPTNAMRRQVLPMQAAQRLYHEQKEAEYDTPRALEPVLSSVLNTNSRQLLSTTCTEKTKLVAKKK